MYRCRFSQMLKPVWEEAAKATKNEFPEEGRVALAGVDCESEGKRDSSFTFGVKTS